LHEGGNLARLNWLHLSDLHLGLRSSRLLRSEYREAFETDLRKLHQRSGPWDLVIISGDLTARGTEREFGIVTSTLDSLWNYFHSLGSQPALLAIPGDMDFQRGLFPQSPSLNAFGSWKNSKGTLEELTKGLGSFSTWFASWRNAHPLLSAFQEGLLPGDFAATLVTGGDSKVGVLGLNTMLKNAPGDRALALEQLSTATGKDVRQWALQHDLLLLVTHFAPTWLNSFALNRILTELLPPGCPFLHLCGGRSALTLDGSTSPFIQNTQGICIQAPSLFSEIRGPRTWGYVAGQFSSPGERPGLRLFSRIATSSNEVLTLGPSSHQSPEETFDLSLEALLWKVSSENSTKNSSPQALLPAPRVVTTRSKPQIPADLPTGVRLHAALDTEEQKVSGLAWSPSGDALGIGLTDGPLLFWKPQEPQPRWTVLAHLSGLEDLCFSPDGQMLATRSALNVRFWSKDGVQLQATMESEGAALAWSPSGLLATDAGEGHLQLWDTYTWGLVGTLPPPRRSTTVRCLAWSPNGQTLACGCEGDFRFILWKREAGASASLVPASATGGTPGATLSLAWMPGTSYLALADRDGTILIWDPLKAEPIATLEGHTTAVTNVSFSFDGRLLASRSRSGTLRLWRTDTWEETARIEEPVASAPLAGLAFSPTSHVLAALSRGSRGVRLWAIDIEALLQAPVPSTTVHAVSAKVVLVGEGRAGKSSLALRMAQDRYEEMEATHGMRFWSLPVGPLPKDSIVPQAKRELILWDMGGQNEYQLVHQLFLRDSAAALMVMEPGRGERALEEIEGWNQRLLAQTGARNIRKILVGTKLDTATSPEDLPGLGNLVKRCQFLAYMPTSAKTGQGLNELKAALAEAIDWSSIETVSRPELFQRLRQHIQRLRETLRVVLTFSELEGELRREMGRDFDPEALRSVVGPLARQGLVADTRLADGTRVLVLEVEQVERYAGSLILAARDNSHGVPALDVAKVLSPAMTFPRLPTQERLRRDQELPILDCVIELLLEHGLCMRHEGLLIFPSLFRPTQSETGTHFPYAISLHYDFSGPIDNIYASLVTSLALSRRFGAMRLWQDRAEFGRAGQDSSGIRRVRESRQGARGYARLDVYFDTETPATTRHLFVTIIEEHLREQGVELIERLSIRCTCGRVFAEDDVRERIKEGLADIGCSRCDHRTPLTLGAQQARERNPELIKQVRAVRTDIQELRSQEIGVTKAVITEIIRDQTSADTPIRILHLSDLHVDSNMDPLSLLQPLEAGLKDRDAGRDVERLDYLVISGDITNSAAPQEFEKAREFVSALIEKLGLTSAQCIFVPGNHDLDWDTEVYTRKKKRQVDASALIPGAYKEDGDGYYVRDDAKYAERFKNFSQHFYHPLTQKPYPLAPEEQCLPSFFRESRLQFLRMNSAWEIDEYFPERSSISEQALSRGLEAANRELADARKRGDLEEGAQVLRIAVWHHPITGNEKIQADAFMGRLLQENVRVCLHGHIHEDRADLVNYLDPVRRLHVVGAGSFGAPTHHRPESVPRLFNLLEIQRDLKRLRVHTRCLRKQGGAWEGWAVWPGEQPGEKRTYYEMTLP
jgi:small GTP-binding protein